MAKLSYYKTELIQVQITKIAHEFLKSYKKLNSNEPYYATVDRMISNYRQKNTAELIDRSEKQAFVIGECKRLVEELKAEKADLQKRLAEIKKTAERTAVSIDDFTTQETRNDQ